MARSSKSLERLETMCPKVRTRSEGGKARWLVGLGSSRTSALGVVRPGGYEPLSQAVLAPGCPCLAWCWDCWSVSGPPSGPARVLAPNDHRGGLRSGHQCWHYTAAPGKWCPRGRPWTPTSALRSRCPQRAACERTVACVCIFSWATTSSGFCRSGFLRCHPHFLHPRCLLRVLGGGLMRPEGEL